MSSMLHKDAARKDGGVRPGAPVAEKSKGRKRSHPSDGMDDTAPPPNVKLPTAVSFVHTHT